MKFASVLLTIVLFNVLSQGDSRNNHRGDRPGNRHGNDWDPIRGLMFTMKNFESRLKKLERAGCETGSPVINICQNDNQTGCFVGEALGNNSTLVKFPVFFNHTFEAVPAVIVGYAGLLFDPNQQSSISSDNVTTTSFDINIFLEGPLPSKLSLFWFACNHNSR